jgi:CRISPR-associated protein Cmr4
MFKTAAPLFFHAETSTHIGSGQSYGAVDLAIQRERYTGFPVGASSGVKGAIRDWFRHQDPNEQDRRWAAFGPDTEHAGLHGGALAFTDARLLLFPIRSVAGVFAWTTCPTVLERFKRDLDGIGHTVGWDTPDTEGEKVAVTSQSVNTTSSHVVLEDHQFFFNHDDDVAALAEWLEGHALPDNEAYTYWRDSLKKRLLVLPDDAFTHFVHHSTEVQARVKLNEKGTTADDGNLFYQENLPCDTLLYSLALAQDDMSEKLKDGSAEALLNYVRQLDGHRLQLGGDASVGRGITRVHIPVLSSVERG